VAEGEPKAEHGQDSQGGALRQLERAFDRKRLGAITTADLERYKQSRVGPGGKRGKMSANGKLAVLSSMVNQAANDRPRFAI
jgi:hypothetical protein